MIDDTKNKILAILYASGEAISGEKIAEVLEIDIENTVKLVRLLDADLTEEGSPLQVLSLDRSFQLATRPEYAGIIRKALEIKRNQPLSQAAFEVLAIIAYNQPVTRGFIEQTRGVDSSGIVSSLEEKGLIEEAGRLELPGRPIAYRTTVGFLRTFGVSSLSQLPKLPGDEEESAVDSDQLAGQVAF